MQSLIKTQVNKLSAIPRFCPNGCGETILAEQPTGILLEQIQSIRPEYKNHWLVSCFKCGMNSIISEGKIAPKNMS